jgi:hypothetical protein
VVVDAEKKEKERNERENLFQVKRKKCVQKEFDRADIVRDAWFVPAQTVDAKPSSQLIRQHFPFGEPICPAVLNQTLARMVFRLNQRSRTTLSDSGPCKWISG